MNTAPRSLLDVALACLTVSMLIAASAIPVDLLGGSDQALGWIMSVAFIPVAAAVVCFLVAVWTGRE